MNGSNKNLNMVIFSIIAREGGIVEVIKIYGRKLVPMIKSHYKNSW